MSRETGQEAQCGKAVKQASFWLKSLEASMLFTFILRGNILFFETLVLVLETLGKGSGKGRTSHLC